MHADARYENVQSRREDKPADAVPREDEPHREPAVSVEVARGEGHDGEVEERCADPEEKRLREVQVPELHEHINEVLNYWQTIHTFVLKLARKSPKHMIRDPEMVMIFRSLVRTMSGLTNMLPPQVSP